MEKDDHIEITSILANERTYAAWVRTGLTALATALILSRLFQTGAASLAVQVIGLILVVISGICFIFGAWRYRHVGNRLSGEVIYGAPVNALIFGSVLLTLVSLLALLALNL